MRKIRGFKLNLRTKEIQRRAKKARVDLVALNLGSDDALAALATPFCEQARPSVLYDSFPAEGSKPAAGKALGPMPGLAYSLALVTLGPEIEKFIEDRTRAIPEEKPVLELLSQSALEDAARFVLALVEEEAKADHCELSPIQYASDPETLKAVVDRLEGHKIGVAAADSGLRPIHSAAFGVSWLSRSKSRAK